MREKTRTTAEVMSNRIVEKMDEDFPNSLSSMLPAKFCFIKFPNEEGLVMSDLRLPIGVSIAEAIMNEIDREPVKIRSRGKIIGQVSGYKIIRNKLEYIEEYFEATE